MLPAGAPPALAQVAQRYADTSRGIVGFQMHRIFNVHGGFSRRSEDLVMNGIYDDGALVRVRVVKYSINGSAASASDVAGVEQSWNHPKPSDVFTPPFDSRNFGAYAYQSGGIRRSGLRRPCTTRATGAVASAMTRRAMWSRIRLRPTCCRRTRVPARSSTTAAKYFLVIGPPRKKRSSTAAATARLPQPAPLKSLIATFIASRISQAPSAR